MAQVLRNPCVKNNSSQLEQPPFSGVLDITQMPPVSLCDNGQLRPEYAKSGVNSALLKELESLTNAAPELQAQVFAWLVVGNLGARPMFDKVLDNGYFIKSKIWANKELAGVNPG